MVLLGISAAANAMVTRGERARFQAYGQKISLPAGDINVYRNGGKGPTLVLISGYGTAAPGLDFAPLIRELDAFDVIVVEGFGYGYSDLDPSQPSSTSTSGGVEDSVSDELRGSCGSPPRPLRRPTSNHEHNAELVQRTVTYTDGRVMAEPVL